MIGDVLELEMCKWNVGRLVRQEDFSGQLR